MSGGAVCTCRVERFATYILSASSGHGIQIGFMYTSVYLRLILYCTFLHAIIYCHNLITATYRCLYECCRSRLSVYNPTMLQPQPCLFSERKLFHQMKTQNSIYSRQSRSAFRSSTTAMVGNVTKQGRFKALFEFSKNVWHAN